MWMGKKHFCFFQTAGNRAPNSGLKGSDANLYPRAPARQWPRFQADVRVHMGPGNYRFFPLNFLPFLWPHYPLYSVKRSDVTGNRSEWKLGEKKNM